MGAPVGNTNASGRKLNDMVRAWVRDNPDRVGALVLVLDQIAHGGFEASVRDRLTAIDMIFNRGFGKPAQVHIGGEDDDPPIQTRATIEFVRPNAA